MPRLIFENFLIRMYYDGYLDGNDGWSVSGWAFDCRRPNEPVEIEYSFSTGQSGTVAASAFRADLQQHGIGDGRHAFSISFPDGGMFRELTITARVKGTDFVLKHSPMPRQRPPSVTLIAGDIVNNCNLRCPFCMVDYANIRGLKLMSEESFRKVLELLPGMPEGSFWLSCLHEPTLHPKFVDFIEMVPLEYRNRLSFTTNLSRRMPPGALKRLAESNVHSIRISFDSREPEVFELLRKGAKYEIFEQNLTELTQALQAQGKARPHLRFITMGFQRNVADLPAFVTYCRERYGANSHEVRFMYYLPHLAEWGKENVLSREQWSALETALEPLRNGYEIEIAGPFPGMREQFEGPVATDFIRREHAFGNDDDAVGRPAPDPVAVGRQLKNEGVRLRLRWDGLVALDAYPEDLFYTNIRQIGDPRAYFHQMRRAAMPT